MFRSMPGKASDQELTRLTGYSSQLLSEWNISDKVLKDATKNKSTDK